MSYRINAQQLQPGMKLTDDTVVTRPVEHPSFDFNRDQLVHVYVRHMDTGTSGDFYAFVNSFIDIVEP